MKKLYSLFTILTLICCISLSYAQLSVSIGTTPAATAGAVNICDDGSIVFTSTSQNVPAGATISWNFAGGTPSSASTIGPHVVSYTTPGTYTATLTINGQSSNVTVIVAPDPGNPVFQITPFLTNFGYSQDTSLTTGEISIYYCGNQFGLYNSNNVQFQMTVGTYPANHQIIVNWGDGTSNTYAGNVGTVSHGYNCTSNNQFTASVSVIGPSGCVTAGLFNIYSGAPPQIFITNNLSTHCIPLPYDFTLNANDIPGTTYQYLFSDNNGAPTTITGPFPVNLEYEFAIHSCFQSATIPGPGGAPITYNNAYAASILATNLCGESFLSIGPIYVSAMPVTDIDMPEYACVGETVDVINTTLLGMMVGPTGCNPTNNWYWTITPNTGYTINNGQLGDGSNPQWFFWQNGSENLEITFNEYGTYAVQLIQANACGTDTIIDSICIVAPILADFTTSSLGGCSPVQISTTNLPYVPSCINNSALYNWSVLNAGSGVCPNEGVLPTYIGGTNSTSIEPQFQFNNPGIYDIQLISSLTNPLPGTLCQADTAVIQVTITQGPNITFSPYAVCENVPITLSNSVEDCYAGNTTFDWSFPSPPASISTAFIQQPTVTFSQPGTYPISVTVSNDCGTQNFPTSIIVHPSTTVTITGPNGACVGNQISLNATLTGGATQGLWSVSPNVGSFNSVSLINPTYTPPPGYTGPLVFTFTTTNAPVQCGQVSQTHLVVYELNATANAGTYTTLCENTTLNLNGTIGGAASSATWSDNVGGTFSDINALNATYTPPANYTGPITFTLITNDPPGSCTAATANASVSVVPTTTIAANSAVSTICQGGNVSISATPLGTFTGVQWTAPSGSFANANQANTTYTPPAGFSGIMNLTATTTGSAPCPAASTVVPITVEPIATIANSSITICSGEQFTYTPNGTAPNILPIGTELNWTIVPNGSISGASANSGAPLPNISQTLTNSASTPQSITYTVQPITTNTLACNGNPFTVTVTVLPVPQVNTVPDASYCSFVPANVVFSGVATSYSWTNSEPLIGLPTSGTGNISFTTSAVSTNTTGIITVTPNFTQGALTCSGSPQTFQITIIPAPSVLPVNNITVCNNGLVNQIDFNASLPGSTFNWTNSQTGINLAASGSGSINAFNATNAGNALLVANISVTATVNSCTGPATPFTISVIPTANVTNASNSQTICNGQNSSAVNWTSSVTGFPTTYAWSIANTGATITGFTASGTGNLPAFTLSNLQNTPGQLVVTVTPTVNGCQGNNFTYTINVNPTPVLSPIPAQTICGGQTFTTPTFNSTVAGTTYSWSLQSPGSVPPTITGYPTTGTGNINGVPVLNSGTQAYTLVYNVTPTANSCAGAIQTFSLTINPSPEVTFSVPNQTICSNNQSVIVNLSSSTIGANFTWNVVPPAGITGLNITSGTNSIPVYTLVNTTPLPITITFQAQATTSGGNACPGPLYNYTITVNPTPTVNAVNNLVVCNGAVVPTINFSGTGTAYNWINNTVGVGLAPSGTGDISNWTALNNSNSPIVADLSVTPVYLNNGVSCSGNATNFSVTINPSGQVNNITNIVACNNSNVASVIFSTNNLAGSTSYDWLNNNPSIGLTASQTNVQQTPGFVGNNLTAVVSTGTVLVTPIYTNGGVSCSGPSTSFDISILPTPTVNTLPNLSYCTGASTNPISFSGTATAYNWTNSLPTIGLAPSGTGNIPSFTATNGTTSPLDATITVTPEFSFGNLTCQGTAGSFIISVNTGPTVDAVSDILVCSGTTIPQINFTGNANQYSWVMAGNNVGSAMSGNDFIPQFTATAGASTVFTATVTVTPGFNANGFVCTGTPITFTITVNPTPTVNPTNSITVCHNTAQSPINFTGTGTNYVWSASNTSIGLIPPGSGNNIIPSFTAQNLLSGVNNVSTITVTPEFSANGLTCQGTPDIFNYTVLYIPVTNAVPNQELCNGTLTAAVNFTGNASSYSWTNNNPSIHPLSLPNGTGNIAAFQATNNGTVSTQGLFTITPTYVFNGVSCNGLNSSFTIQVNPTPNVNPISDVVVCNQASTNQINISGTGTSYSWTNSNTTIGLAATGGSTIPSFVGQNPSNSATNTGTVTITPSFDGQGSSCPGQPVSFQFIVSPTPITNPISNQTVCFNAPTTEVIISGTGTSYNWTNSNASVWPTLSGTNSIPSFIGNNNGTTPAAGTSNFTITPIFTVNNINCSGPSSNFTITVIPNPTVTQVPPQSICNSSLFNGQNYTGTYTALTWNNNNIGTGLAPTGNGNLPSFTGTNPSNTTPLTSEITVIPTYTHNGLTCTGANMLHTIAVLPTTVIENIPNVVVCNGVLTNPIPITTAGTSVQWSANPTSIGLATGNAFTIPAFTATNTSTIVGATPVVSTVNITPTYTDALGTVCVGTPNSFTITVNPSPVITEIADYTVCNNGVVSQFLTTNIPSDIQWSASFNPNISGASTTLQNSNLINNGLNNSSMVPQQLTYTANATSTPAGCPSQTMEFVVNLMPNIVMLSQNNYEICTGTSVAGVFQANVPSSFNWFGTITNGVNGISTSIQTSGAITDTPINTTTSPQLVIYNVTPTSLDGSCVGAPQIVSVLVNPPPALISATSSSTCSNSPVGYNFIANQSAVFNWYGIPNPNVQGISTAVQQSAQITDVLINNSGLPQNVTYFVTITSVADNNCTSPAIPITITVNPLPVVDPLSLALCTGSQFTFNLEASEPSNFQWIGVNNINVTGETLTLQTSSLIQNTLTNNTFDVQNVLYNIIPTSQSTGCVGLMVQHTAVVNPLPNLTFTVPNLLCAFNEIPITNNSSTPLNVIWDFGNNTQSIDFNPILYYETPGNYLITYYGINPQTGCENTIFVPITINEAPPVDFAVNVTEGCIPALFEFQNTAENPGSILQWNFGDGVISNEQGIAEHFYLTAGCYDVTLTATGPNGCPNSITYEDMVCAYNVPIAGFVVNDPIQYSDVNEFIFENLTVFGYTYHWDFGDGMTSNAVHPAHSYPIERNIYQVMLVATNEAGCSDTTFLSVQVKERLIFYVPNTFTPDGNTRNEEFKPIFTAGYDKYTYELAIFNRWGEILFESYNDDFGWDGTYGGNVMPDGTYIWRIRFKNLDDEDYQEYYGHVNLLR
jgi:gliding motility-associated-like protein